MLIQTLRRHLLTAAPLAAGALLLGCTTGPDLGGSGGPRPIPASATGKADNYVSSNAREYLLSGVAHAQLSDAFATLSAEAQQSAIEDAVNERLNTVSRSIRSHIDKVLRATNGTRRGDDAEFFTYFKSNNHSAEGAEALADGRARFEFELELVGDPELMSLLLHYEASPPGDAVGDGELNRADLEPVDGAYVHKFAVEVSESRSSYYNAYNGVDDGAAPTPAETVDVAIKGTPSTDSFPKYNELFADGVYDISVHFGGDYNEGRHDIDTAKWLVETLVERKWDGGVASFDALKIDSPPFTRSMIVEGHEVEARIRIYHSDMVTEADEEKLAQVMKTSLKHADVVIYSGHAGPNAGFILDYQPKFEIDNKEFEKLELADKYQIYVFDGCQTYRTYVDDIMKNPHKTFDNVDIVTTVNTTPFSVGYQVLHEFIYWLTITDNNGRHYPVSWNQILKGINTEDFQSVHYGVHGIDQDPKVNPYTGTAPSCQACDTDADCGAGGNFCLQLEGGGRCGVACTTSEACGEGFSCSPITEDPDIAWYYPKQCIPSSRSCG